MNKLPTHPAFTRFEERTFPHAQRRTAESLTATIGTHSHTTVVTPEERAEVLSRIRTFLNTNPATADGEFDRHRSRGRCARDGVDIFCHGGVLTSEVVSPDAPDERAVPGQDKTAQ